MTATIAQDATHIIFSNDIAIFKIAKIKNNRPTANSDFLTISGGSNLIDEPVAFVAYDDGSTKGAKSVSYTPTNDSDGTLAFGFQNGQMMLRCRAYETHFFFELLEIGDSLASTASKILIGRLRIDGQENSSFAGIIYSGDSIISELALDIETNVVCTVSAFRAISALALPAALEPTPRLPRLKVALLACPKSQWVSFVEAVEIEHGLPHPTIDGTWAKQHPDVHSSYLFVDIKETNAPAVIDYALQGRFKYIVPYASTWAHSTGTYQINAANYPSGLPGLQSVVARVHKHDLKFGFHTLSCLISPDDPYVTPTPDPRLAKESPIALAGDIDANTTFIPTSGSLSGYVQYLRDGEPHIIIENEIMKVEDVIEEGEAGFVVQRRPTTAVSHPAIATIYHLPEYKGKYFPDLRSNLLAEIADNFAAIYTFTKGDFAFLDGSETLERVFEWDWFPRPLIGQTFFRRLSGNVFLQGSGTNVNYQWHPLSRGVSNDYAAIGVEAYMDFEKVGRFGQRYEKAFFPQELGWIGMLAKTRDRFAVADSFASTTLDEIEYQMNRALGYGLPIGLETNVADLEANHQTPAILDLIGEYEQLRLTNYFPASIVDRLKEPDEEFRSRYRLRKEQYHLVKHASGAYALRRQAYAEHLVLDANNETWVFENPFANQPMRGKITALPSYGGYEGESLELANALLSGFTVVEEENAPGVTCRIEGFQIKATFTPPDEPDTPPLGWCSLKKVFTAPLDLSNYKVIGLLVTGDGRGEVISIELADEQEYNRQYQFTIDFTDAGPDGTPQPRPMILPIPATDELFKYPYDRQGIPRDIKRSLRPLNYKEIKQLTIHVKNIPEGDITFSLGAIKALRQRHGEMSSPTFVLNGRTTLFPISLQPRKKRTIDEQKYYFEPWEYLVFSGSEYRKFDGNHQELEIGAAVGEPPRIRHGENTITYHHEGANKALFTILMDNEHVHVF
jgi:hypothetical protein